MAQPDVTSIVPRPTSVVFNATGGVRFTPNELRALKDETGRGLQDLLGPEADDADRMQTVAWLNLRREGTPVPWNDCGDIAIDVQTEPLDPTNAAP